MLVKVSLAAFALKHLKYQVIKILLLTVRCPPPLYPALQADNKAALSKGFGSYVRLWKAREDRAKIVLMLSVLLKAQQEPLAACMQNAGRERTS